MGQELSKKEEVTYNNRLNEVVFQKFTDRDFNLFISIIARVSGKGTNNQIKIDYATLKRLSGFEKKHISNKEFNVMLADMNKKLMECTCFIQDGSREIDFVLFPEFIRDPEKGMLTVKVSERLGYVVNDFHGYTSLELKRFVRLESKYTKTLYRKLRQFRRTGEYIVTANQFRLDFAVPDSYKQGDIQRRIINPSVDELKNDFKDLKCIIHQLPTRGNPVDRYTFRFQPTDQIQGQITANEYLESLETNSTKQNKKITKKSKNNFNNFPQNEYNFEELENLLVEN